MSHPTVGYLGMLQMHNQLQNIVIILRTLANNEYISCRRLMMLEDVQKNLHIEIYD